MGQKTSPIYDAKYYKVQRILGNPKFWNRINKLKARFAKFGCRIPAKGLANNRDYLAWRERLYKACGEARNSNEYTEAKKKITGGKQKINLGQLSDIEKLDEELLPPITFGNNLNDILFEFGLNPKDRLNKLWIENLFLYNKREYSSLFTVLKLTYNKKTGEPELWARIFGHTKIKIEGMPNKVIEDWKKNLPDYRGKNKQRDKTLAPRNKWVVNIWSMEKQKLIEDGLEKAPNNQAIASICTRWLPG